MRRKTGWMLAGMMLCAAHPVGAQNQSQDQSQNKGQSHPVAEAQALELAKQAIALRSVAGPGNETAKVAALFKAALVKGGFAAEDVEIHPLDDTAYFIARWRGKAAAAKPLVISGHMDVVEAKPSDWARDPFTPIVENGYLYGRGASDMKLDAALAIATLIEMKRQGYTPRRDIILQFSGDEETTMKTSQIIAERFKNAELVLNIDGGGGSVDEASGKARYFTWQGAEKTYADFELSVTNPGGHSSAPRKINAINQLSAALVKIGAYRFTPELNDISRSYFDAASHYEDKEIAAAMRRFAANPADAGAVATLADNPAMVGKIGTTCVTTMMNGGHALNALPQRATANINCRIFPGHKPADIMAELQRVAADPAIRFKDVSEGSTASPASPVRADFVAAVTKAMHKIHPKLPVFPSMASGASDSMWYRALGVPSYGASPLFMKDSDDFSHGLNERVPVANIAPAITYYLSLFTDLSQ